MLGSLVCVMEDRKTRFKVGSGLTDDRRVNPPAVSCKGLRVVPRFRAQPLAPSPQIGSIITYRFQELTQQKIPRFPTFVGERFDVDGPKDAEIAPTTNGDD